MEEEGIMPSLVAITSTSARTIIDRTHSARTNFLEYALVYFVQSKALSWAQACATPPIQTFWALPDGLGR